LDAAQELEASLLDFIERLAMLNEDESPLFLMIFIGLPRWEDLLRRPEHRELDRQIALRLTIPKLTPRLARDYIEFRVTSAGGRIAEVMSNAAIGILVRLSDGNPGRIHAMADRALELGLLNRHQPVTASDIRAARKALALTPFRVDLRSWITARRTMAIGFVTLGLAIAGVGWMMRLAQSTATGANPAATAARTGVAPATLRVTVAPGETMQTLLRHYGLPETGDEVALVQALNPKLGTSDAIYAGQVLLLPAPASIPPVGP
jgi:LysM repeat protein